MKHANRQKAIELFQTAVKLTPEEKSSFLNKECGEDIELRRSVDELLESEKGKITEDATMYQITEVMFPNTVDTQPTKINPTNQNNETNSEDQSNKQFGHYKIIRKIGAGGMGEVYLAHDATLNRKVALKLLPPKLTNDTEYLQRFKQEARAASALNHPYILTIFEFGQNEEGVHFIVSEFVEGQTLDKFCESDSVDILDKLDILIRVASALSAAHEAGIIHRDIKPENIIVRPDDYIKVLDFGLAKLMEHSHTSDTDPEAATRPLVSTNPGMIMGTANYMSPEQAKGNHIDARTDIFSFGIVLYEMIAGHLPFKGNSMMEMIAAILHKNPQQILDPEIPDDLKRIINKTLKKDRDKRYQTMKELLIDLKEVKREMEFKSKLEESIQPNEEELKEVETQIYKTKTTARTFIEKNTAEVESASVTETGKRLPYFQTITVLVLIMIVGGLFWWIAVGRMGRTEATDLISPGSYKTQKLTNWANSAGELSTTARFSGDGRFIAFGSTKTGTTSIWVKQTNSGDAIQVTKDEFYNRYPIWSPDGNEIAYYSKRGNVNGLWRVSLMGGQQKLIAENVDSESKPRLWSKSGKIYFQGSYNLFAADERSSNITQITDFPSNGTPVNIINIAPDESQIAFLVIENNEWKIKIKEIKSSQNLDIFKSDKPINNIVWTPDGKNILFSQKSDEFYQIYKISIDGGDPVQISFDNGDSFVEDVSVNDAEILFSSVNETADLWKLEIANAKESIFASEIEAELWADVSPDNNSVVYQSIKNLRQGSNLLNGSIITQSDSKDARPLQLSENGFLPQWSPDGQKIAFLRLEGQKFELQQVTATGDMQKVISADGIQGPEYSLSPYMTSQVKSFSWSPNSTSLAFPATRDGVSNIWLSSSESSTETKLSDNRDKNQYLYAPIFSSDKNLIAFCSRTNKRDSEGKRKYYIWLYDIEKQEQQKILETEDLVRVLGWSKNGEELIFARKKEEKEFTLTPKQVPISAVSVKSGEQRELTNLEDTYFYNIFLSPDKNSVAFTSRSGGQDDVWIFSPLESGEPRKLTGNNDPRLYYSSLVWSPDSRTLFFGKQTRFTLLSMLINPKSMENKDNESKK